MRICGLQKFSLVDYPGKLAATVFTGGCNFRCPFCHNAPLVTQIDPDTELTVDEVLSFLKSRKGLLDGVVLSGGEPLLHDGVADFARAVREIGFCFKLDTNGSFPDRLSYLLNEGLLDYVAMDIKNSLPKYAQTIGVPGYDTAPIERSVQLLMQSGIPFEFRTTLVKELHSEEDMIEITHWLEGAPRYALQTFVDSGNLIGSGLSAFSPEQMERFAKQMQPYLGEVILRGV